MEIYNSKISRGLKRKPKTIEEKYQSSLEMDLIDQDFSQDIIGKQSAQRMLASSSEDTDSGQEEEVTLIDSTPSRGSYLTGGAPDAPLKKPRKKLKLCDVTLPAPSSTKSGTSAESGKKKDVIGLDKILQSIEESSETITKLRARMEDEGYDNNLIPVTVPFLKKQLEMGNPVLLEHIEKMKVQYPQSEISLPTLGKRKLPAAKKNAPKPDDLFIDKDFTEKKNIRPKSYYCKVAEHLAVGVGKAEGYNKSNKYYCYDSYFLHQYKAETLKSNKATEKPTFSMQIPVRSAQAVLKGLDACIQQYEGTPSQLR